MSEASFFAEPRNWVAIAYILFFVLVGRKLWAVITGLLDGRTESIRAELDEVKRLREEAETMLRDANARRVAAVSEANALLEGARAEATRLAAAAEAEANSAASRRERLALDRIAAAEKAAVDEVRIAAAEIAAIASARIIREGLTPEADGQLIDTAIGGLSSALGRRAA
jgi:F-type H+-transporting ATPase subunit b